MTQKEAYVMGYIFGLYENGLDNPGANYARKYDAMAKPLEGIAQISRLYHSMGLTAADGLVGEAYEELTPNEGLAGRAPMACQGSWDLGYNAARMGRPLFDIAVARKGKGMTQAELAAAVGVTQAQVSRWESGMDRPGPENMTRLMSILQ